MLIMQMQEHTERASQNVKQSMKGEDSHTVEENNGKRMEGRQNRTLSTFSNSNIGRPRQVKETCPPTLTCCISILPVVELRECKLCKRLMQGCTMEIPAAVGSVTETLVLETFSYHCPSLPYKCESPPSLFLGTLAGWL